MLFSSFVFILIFLPLVVGVYFILRSELRNLFLLVASLFFYAWGEPKFIVVMLASIIINYTFGVLVNTFRYRIVLALGILSNLSVLVYFKYYNFLFIQLQTLLSMTPIGASDWVLVEVLLPIGISFYTFQGISYLVDVYRKTSNAQKNPINLALYIALFPQLIAGPTVRYSTIEAQISNPHRKVSLEEFSGGLKLFMIGMAKKVLIANTMAVPADAIFSLPIDQIGFLLAWLGIVTYSFQIYFDFSGYSDMAIGLGRMFGFTFPLNFNYPYMAKSMTDFWRRWHISLSSWFRDYLYIPLGGNRTGKVRNYINLVIVFGATGIWHGASWTFLIWGLWHGLFLVIEKLMDVKNWIYSPVKNFFLHIYVILTFLLGWVFFRSESIKSALLYIKKMFTPRISDLGIFFYYFDNKLIFFILLSVFASTDMFKKYFDKKYLGEIMAFIIFFLSIMFLADSTYNPFLYFRF